MTEDAYEILYNSGRVRLWLRLPCLLLALLCLAIAIDLILLLVVGQTMLLPPLVELPMGWLPAVLGTVLLAAFLLQVWLGRKRILWEAQSGELLLEECRLFGTSRRRFGQHTLAAVQARRKRLRASTFWDIYIRERCGQVTWLTRAYTEADALAIGGRIAARIDRPLEVTA